MSQQQTDGKKNNPLVILAMVLIPLVVMLAVFFLPDFLRDREEKRVLQSGVEAEAEIVDLEDTGNRYNSNPEVEIILLVTPEDGKPYRASVRRVISPVDMPDYEAGRKVRVKYDPDKPESVALAGSPR